jgi:serine/threonine-protein kinase
VEAGTRLNERYRLLERHGGRGGPEVWRSLDELFDRTVIVTFLPSGGGDGRDRRREPVSRAASLSHPAIAAIFDYDRTRNPDGLLTSFVVTELPDGEDLDARIERDPPAYREALDICTRVAEALAAAHAAGVTHGNLERSKIHLTSGGVKVTGFETGTLTSGPPAEAADVFSLGVVLSACLSASLALDARSLTSLPQGVARLRWRCCAVAPEDRPTAAEAAAVLSSADRPPDTARPQIQPPLPPRPRSSTSRVGRTALALALVTTIVTTVAVLLSSSGGALNGRNAAPADRPPMDLAARPPQSPLPQEIARTIEALGSLQTQVYGAVTKGEIRSDVALDIGNLIRNLQNDLTTNQRVDVPARVNELKEKVSTRLRERALSEGLADRLTSSLSRISP